MGSSAVPSKKAWKDCQISKLELYTRPMLLRGPKQNRASRNGYDSRCHPCLRSSEGSCSWCINYRNVCCIYVAAYVKIWARMSCSSPLYIAPMTNPSSRPTKFPPRTTSWISSHTPLHPQDSISVNVATWICRCPGPGTPDTPSQRGLFADGERDGLHLRHESSPALRCVRLTSPVAPDSPRVVRPPSPRHGAAHLQMDSARLLANPLPPPLAPQNSCW
jgi:hypothetical protein